MTTPHFPRTHRGNAVSRTIGAISALGIVTTMFTAPSASAAATPVNLGAAADFAVLGASTVTNTGLSVLTRAVGVSPGTAVTGFPPGLVTPVPADGAIHSNDTKAVQAQSDLHLAFTAIGVQPAQYSLPDSIGGGAPIVPGVYDHASALAVAGTVTLDAQGDPHALFIFRTGSTLITASNSVINLINGADACNVFWQVGSSATLGTGTTFAGSILASASITATTGTSVQGRLLALSAAVTLDTNAITTNNCAKPAATVVVAPSSSAVRFGDLVTLTATVGPTGATGTVTFVNTPADGGLPVTLGTANVVNGKAVISGPASSFGLNTVTASYSGDATYGAAASASAPVEVSGYAGEVLITEFRGSGPGGSEDSYLEIYNTGPPVPLAGFVITSGSGSFVLTTDAPVLGTFRSYLITGAAYSLGLISGSDLTRSVGAAGAKLQAPDTAGTTTDSVGAAGLGTLPTMTGSPTAQYAWVRTVLSGRPSDTRSNAADFQLVSTSGGKIGDVQSTLGSPSPTGTASAYQQNGLLLSTRLDPAVSTTAAPNRSYVAGSQGAPGTLVVRRTITNTTGAIVLAAKIRITSISELNGAPMPGAGAQPTAKAQLRLVNPVTAFSLVPVTAGGTVLVQNLSVDAPVLSAPGGGLNSTLTIPLAGGLAIDGSVNVAFTFKVDTGGSFWFGYDVDALS